MFEMFLFKRDRCPVLWFFTLLVSQNYIGKKCYTLHLLAPCVLY